MQFREKSLRIGIYLLHRLIVRFAVPSVSVSRSEIIERCYSIECN